MSEDRRQNNDRRTRDGVRPDGERRSGGDRRAGDDRRVFKDRRIYNRGREEGERRSGNERRKAPAPSAAERERYEKMQAQRAHSSTDEASELPDPSKEYDFIETRVEPEKKKEDKFKKVKDIFAGAGASRLWVKIALLLAALIFVIFSLKNCFHKAEKAGGDVKKPAAPQSSDSGEVSPDETVDKDENNVPQYTVPNFVTTDATVIIPSAAEYQSSIGAETIFNVYDLTPAADAAVPCPDGDDIGTQRGLVSTNVVLVDLETNEILVSRDSGTVLSPASMTKIMTVLTAMDYIDESEMDTVVTISQEICDYCYLNDCSAVGYMPGEQATVRQLLYGVILPSGADAALALAEYVAGSEEAFVELMNQKLDEMGLSSTAHFVNCTGIYDENHHCTVKDIAVILATAIQNETLAEVLNARTYQLPADEFIPDGMTLSNLFLRRIEDYETNGNVIAAKTGYVSQAGCCAASCMETESGHRYICVTANSFSSWRTIYDHISLYRSFTP
ncbi:MAG: serine hydrolase [Lachnospiraceae bacterium]|nr:serine hydrolase [Lachnospiraceae bacterium]